MLRLGRSRWSGMLRPQGVCRRWLSSDPSVGSPIAPQPLAAAAPQPLAAAAPLLRLPMQEDEVAILEERLKYKFRDRTLLEDALTHTSYPNRTLSSLTDPPSRRSYKPFKLIGERALYSYTKFYGSQHLVHLNLSPHKLARTAIHLGLYQSLRRHSPKLDLLVDDYIKVQEGKLPYPGIPLNVPNILPHLVHAIMGAIDVDSNYKDDTAWEIMELHLPLFSLKDLKSRSPVHALYAISEDHQMNLEFTNHCRENLYTTETLINKIVHGSGTFDLKRQAKSLSALDALNKLPAHMSNGTDLFNGTRCGFPFPHL